MTGKNATERQRADSAGISHAAEILRDGGIVAVPTETVYGLAARADDPAAVARIYTAKGRPSRNPLIVHVADIEHARQLAHFSGKALAIAEWGWPGALTLVLPRRDDCKVAAAVSANLSTIAIRVPQDAVMQAVLRKTGLPLAAPSANRSNAVSPTTANHVEASLGGRIDMILDNGPCAKGLESSILAIRHDGSVELLRPGPVDASQWIDSMDEGTGTVLEAPGQMVSHYSPGKPVRLAVTVADADEFMIGFGSVTGDISLSPSGDVHEAAAALYSALHAAASSPKRRVAIAPIPQTGVGAAINDRLTRAAATP